jgi:hypothetical protein
MRIQRPFVSPGSVPHPRLSDRHARHLRIAVLRL